MNKKLPIFSKGKKVGEVPYADLGSCWDAIRKPLTDNGLSFIQSCSSKDDGNYLTNILSHLSGQYIESEIYIGQKGLDAKTFGSNLTYYKRYSLCSMLGIVGDDDLDIQGTEPSPPKGDQSPKQSKQLSDAQVKRIYAIGGANGFDASDIDYIVKVGFKVESKKNLSPKQYDALIAELEKGDPQGTLDRINPKD